MNESTAKQFSEILAGIEKLKHSGVSDGVARFQALTKLIAMVLARQDYLEEMVEYLVKAKEKKESQ